MMNKTVFSSGGKKHFSINNVFLYMIAVFSAVIILIPILIMIATAFKTDQEISLAGFRWLQKSFFNVDNFVHAWQSGDWLLYFKNSIIVTLCTVVGSLLINSMAGFAFAKLRFMGKKLLFLIVLGGMMIPSQAIIIPQFLILKHFPFAGGNNLFGIGGIGLLDTYAGLIIPFLSGSFGIFLCRQFYLSFPYELLEAAKIDGCSAIKAFFCIFLPNSKQILATLAILKFVSCWNDYFFPLIITQSEKMKTIQLALQMFNGSTTVHYNWLMAATLFTSVPMVIVFLVAQKCFVQGITSTGLKG